MEIISKFSATLHEPRWDSVQLFCRVSVRPIAILRRAWSQAAYGRNGLAALVERKISMGPRFVPADLTAILKSPKFRAYKLLVTKLKLPLRILGSWFEGCACHEGILKRSRDQGDQEQAARRGRSSITDM